MFNQSRKEKFLSQFTARAKPEYIRLFNNAESVESKYNMDLAELNNDQLTEVFSEKMGSAPLSLDKYLRKVRSYRGWCEEHGYPVSQEGTKITVDKSAKLRKQMVVSAQDLYDRMEAVFPPRELFTTDCLYRAYIWLIFMGLEKEEAVVVRKSDVDLGMQVVHVGDKSYKIPPEGSSDFYIALTVTEFTKFVRGNASIKIKRSDSGFLLSGTREGHLTYGSLLENISTKFKSFPYDINYRQLALSNRYIDIYKSHESKDVFEYHVQEMFLRTNAGKTPDDPQSKNYKRYMRSSFKKQYIMWKQAFQLP